MARPPARIGPYEIQARLGAGGMAEAYLALRRGPGGFVQRVCIKRIRPDAADDPELVRQFRAEAAVVARLRHAAITQVLDFGEDHGDYYLALELIDGVDLRELLTHHPRGLGPGLVHHLAIELATALDFAHRAGGEPGSAAIVHRDVSSSNVLLSREGEVKLSDFGIARPLDAAKFTRTGIVKGKVPYLAPEYARTGRFDARCDLFSLGVVLYECLGGERPHDGATELETLERAGRGERRALRTLAPAAPDGLVEQIESLLEADPQLRTPSAAQLLEALLALHPSPRARRELGSLVAQCKAARRAETAPPLAAEPAPGPTERWDAGSAGEDTSSAPEPAVAGVDVPLAGTRVRIGRNALIALASALVLGAAVLVLAAQRAPAPAAVSSGVATPNHAVTPPSTTQTAVPDDRAGAPSAEPRAPAASAAGESAPAAREAAAVSAPAAPPAASAQDAALEVIVMPYGVVSIDGRELGNAPVTVRLPPGEHAIRARNRDGALSRQITLRAGERKQIVLR